MGTEPRLTRFDEIVIVNGAPGYRGLDMYTKIRATWRFALLTLSVFSVSSALGPFVFADGGCVLRGRVVSTVTGHGVSRALVEVTGRAGRAEMTDSDGTFEFKDLAAGDTLVQVRKPGYFSAREYYPESIGQQHVQVAPGMRPIELKLYPEAVVFGRVTNENGRPLEGFSVQLVRPGKHLLAAGPRTSPPNAVTNENGEYRIAEIRGGNYLLRVERKSDAGASMVLFQAVKFRIGYPTYFYPNVTDAAAATTIKLAPGRHVQADLRLTSQPLYQVSGKVEGASGAGPMVVVLVGQQDEYPVAASALPPGTTDFRLEGIPAGTYLLGAIQPEDRGEAKTGIYGKIELHQNQDGLGIVLAEPKPIDVQFHYQFTQTIGNPAEGLGLPVSLQRTDLPFSEGATAATLLPDPSNPTEGMPVGLDAGTYRARVNDLASRCVASVRSGDTDLLTDDFVVSGDSGPQAIEVTIRDDCSRVGGTVQKDGQPTAGRVLLIPDEHSQRTVSTAANSDGSFSFQGILPGKYVAVALENAEDFDTEDLDALGKARALGTAVELEPSATTTVSLESKSLEQ